MLDHASSLVRVDDGDIRILRISRPESLNALSRDILAELSHELKELANNETIRALIITGEGEKAFCAGADLKERRDMSLDQTREFVQAIGSVFRELELVEIPTIAAINGVAFGGGLELALACDFRIAVKSAKMGLTECGLGIMPGGGGTQRLPRLVGFTLAKEMIFGAKVISAEVAHAVGLVGPIAEDSVALMDEAYRMVEGFRRCAPLSVKAAKLALRLGAEVAIEQGLVIENQAYETLIETEDRVEGLKAFAEKRTPKFAGK